MAIMMKRGSMVLMVCAVLRITLLDLIDAQLSTTWVIAGL
jgi:hypothetical protein